MNLKGIFVPIVTPFTADNRIDIVKLKQLAEQFIQKGVAGIVACGTTGESYTFSPEERTQVLTAIAEVGKGKTTLIAGINSLSTDHSIALAHEAKSLGYDGLMLAPNAYSLPSQDGIIAHFETVASAVQMPIVMYNFPARVGVNMEFETVQHLSQNPYIVGIKESSGNFSQALRLLQADLPDFEVVCGCDDQPVDFFFWGCQSWIAGAANVFPEEQVALFQAAQNQNWDEAKRIMTAMYPALHSMESGDYNQKAKAGCLKGTFDAGKVRIPLINLNENDKADFVKLVKQV